jgi:hypothetical protein
MDTCGLLWTPRFVGFEYAMKLKGDEEDCPKEMKSKEF